MAIAIASALAVPVVAAEAPVFRAIVVVIIIIDR